MRNFESTVKIDAPKVKEMPAFEVVDLHGFSRSGATLTYANPHLNDVRVRTAQLIQALQKHGVKVLGYRLVEVWMDSEVFDSLGLLH